MRRSLFAAISGAWLLAAAAEQAVIPAQNDLETLEHAESSLAEADARPLADPGRGAARFSAMQMLRIDSREESQAENLIARVLKKDPKARIFVYVGYSHVLKGSELVNGKPQIWMAERLKRKTGIDPLSIDETKMKVPLPGTRERALIDAIFAETRADSVVLADRSNERTIYTFDASRVDLQVFHRTAKVVSGREDWLAMNGYRKPRDIPAELLPANGRRLIQAFVDGESVDAVPMDQVLVTAGQPVPVLMLPKGKYRFAFLEKGGQSPSSGDGK